MHLLITGANCSLGQLAVEHFRAKHQLRLTDMEGEYHGEHTDLPYQAADLRNPAEVPPLVQGIDAILHLAIFDPAPSTGKWAEQERLDLAARGTYVLLSEARQAGVERVVLVSTLAQFEAYPTHYIIDEGWQPEPAPIADELAPYLAEITCREFAREGGLRAICLRFGAIEEAKGTSAGDALQAIIGALALPFTETGYRWRLFHVSGNKRFPFRSTHKQALGFETEGGS